MRVRALCAALAALLLINPLAALADWTAAFEPPAEASGALRIDLPEDLDFLVLTTLSVELDGQDVTQDLAFDGGDFVYYPEQPLAPGDHELRLLMAEGGGALVEKQVWRFSVEAASGAPAAAPTAAYAELLSPDDGFFDGSQPLLLRLAGDIPGFDYATLQVEIDQIDMTAILSAEGETVSLDPPERLSPGQHLLSVSGFTQSGDFVELGVWTLTVPAPASPAGQASSLALRSNNSLELLARLAESDLPQPSDPFAASGSGESNLLYESGRWSFEGGTNYFLESQREVSMTDEVFDIGEYQTRASYDGEGWAAAGSVGHQSLGYDSLILSNFYRRGLSLRGDLGDGRVSAQGFALAAASQVGAEDPLGLAERSGEVLGGGLSAEPFDLGEDQLTLTALYYNGEEGVEGFGAVQNTQDLGEGDGWSLGFDSYWFDRRLNLSGEIARTNFDADGSGGLVGEEEGDGYALGGRYELIRDAEWAGEWVNLGLTGGWERLGSFFQSVANPGLAADRDSFYGGADLLWGGLFSSLQLRQDDNNVDDLPGLPSDRARSISLDGQYSFTIERENPEDRAWLGSPYLLFGALYAEADRLKTPAAYLGPDTDNSTLSYYLGVGSSYESWSWQITHQRSEFDDGASLGTDNRTALTDVSLQWYVNRDLSVSLGSQFTENENPDLGTRNYDFNGLLRLDAVLIPETLDLELDYNMNLRSGSGDTPDRHLLSGELGWTLRPADVNQVGVVLALRGSMEWNGGSGNDEDIYESFAVLRLLAPLAN